MFHMIRNQSILLRKIRGRFDGFMNYGLSARGEVIADSSTRHFAMIFGLLLFAIAVAMALAFGGDHSHSGIAGLALSGVLGTTTKEKKGSDEAKKPANIRKMEADLKALARELEVGQTEMEAGPITQERGEELEEKAAEMESLQDHIDRYNKIAGYTRKARQTDRVTLPRDEGDGIDRKAIYTTPGHLFVASQALKTYKDQGKQGWSAKLDIGKLGRKMILRGEQAREFEKKAYDPANLPILGDDAIIPVERDNEIVRYQEPEILTIRDVLNVTPTSADAIKFVRHVLTTRAAATVGRGQPKPYLKIEFAPQTVNVETIAVLSKVTEQDIDDAPRLISYINGEMTLDTRVEEERQITWGNGTNELSGLFNDPDIPEFDRAEIGDTVIDTIRRMRTDLRKARVNPNFVAIDPIDWEEVEVAKGTDAHYLWGLISDLRGPRIWSMRVVESDAMTNPETGERRILEGDGIRGATVYDRQQVQLAVGFVDDDFARNLRTLRAEERLALAIKRPFAFKFAVTAEPTS
jgi:HK97 family phage major capsid protein